MSEEAMILYTMSSLCNICFTHTCSPIYPAKLVAGPLSDLTMPSLKTGLE